MEKQNIHNLKPKNIAAIFLTWLGNLLVFLTIWLSSSYDDMSVDRILFQLKAPSEGLDYSLLWSFLIEVLLFSILACAAEIFLYRLFFGEYGKWLKKAAWHSSFKETAVYRFFKKRVIFLSLLLLFGSIFGFIIRFQVIAHVEASVTDSMFIEEEYVDPAGVTITFPEKKRNLIYIFLESMESTFGDPSIDMNYIPELSALAEENVNFSGTDVIGGAMSYTGTTWTAAAMVTQTSGLPIKVPFGADAYGTNGEFMPGLPTLGEILEREGYEQVLLLGSDAQFHGRQEYFAGHGHYEIIDTDALKEAGRLPADYDVWWGYEDEKLFGYAKEELTRLAESGEPFNFTMLTADTHFPDGYKCSLCVDTYESPYANVLSCASGQVGAFVEWIKEQPFYENTTVIICGDHLTMDPDFIPDLDESYVRSVYNCIINAPIEPVQEKDRLFGTFDLFPTTIAALGAQIEGEKLGLGVNLFSGVETLTEKYGFEAVNAELERNSEFYNVRFLGMEPEE